MVTKHYDLNKEYKAYETMLAKLPTVLKTIDKYTLEELSTYLDLLYTFAYPSATTTSYKEALKKEINHRLAN